MTSLSGSKLNRLLSNWPNGTVFLTAWLKEKGYPPTLLSQYRRNSWISSLGRDTNVRPNDKVDWTGGLYAIQKQLQLPVHAGGKTALQLHGYSHFLQMSKGGSINLFGPAGVKLPSWFLKHDWNLKLSHTMTNLLPYKNDFGLTRKEMGAYSIKVSSPERAIMEFLHLVPQKDSYEEAKLLMEGLPTLRPDLVQKLLENCRSIKVKRLFMHLAEISNLRWVSKLNMKKICFGKGKRVIVKGGHFDSKYNISVPDLPSEKAGQ